MSDNTGIQWTDATWNPVRGCSRVSPGCVNCYAERTAARFSGPGAPYEGLVRLGEHGPRWTGKVELVPHVLDQPRRWKKPRRIFVNSMSDLFHESLSKQDIAQVFAAMAAAPQHTFQVLTKRAARMAELLTEWDEYAAPLPNVWLGVSVEDQQRADERTPHLLATPAAVRFLSCEPLLEPVDLASIDARKAGWRGVNGGDVSSISAFAKWQAKPMRAKLQNGVDWVIVGGESGPGARQFRIGWAESLVKQCAEAGVACFVKQLGADPVAYREPDGSPDDDGDLIPLALADKKGGDMAEWPEELRVRQFPDARP